MGELEFEPLGDCIAALLSIYMLASQIGAENNRSFSLRNIFSKLRSLSISRNNTLFSCEVVSAKYLPDESACQDYLYLNYRAFQTTHCISLWGIFLFATLRDLF